jgi:hypothetical protein
MIRPKRNKKRFCSCVHKEYKAIKNGKPLRKNSKYPYQSALRTCTKELKAVGKVRCGRIIKRGRPLISG